jgi:hypothetical protein
MLSFVRNKKALLALASGALFFAGGINIELFIFITLRT